MYCSSLSWGVAYPNSSHEGNCRPENYTGIVCRQQLMTWQDCAVGGAEKDVFLDLTLMEQSQEESERDAAQFLHFLCELCLCIILMKIILKWTNWLMHAASFGSDHCQRAAGLFVCQSYFPICNECHHGRSYLASREECERLSMAECEEEWESARQHGIYLPNCTDLPEEVIGEDSKGLGRWFALGGLKLISWL